MRIFLMLIMLTVYVGASSMAYAGTYNCPSSSSVKAKLSKKIWADGKSGKKMYTWVKAKAGKFKRGEISYAKLKCFYSLNIDGVDLPKTEYQVTMPKKPCAGGVSGFTPKGGIWVCNKSNPHQCKASCG